MHLFLYASLKKVENLAFEFSVSEKTIRHDFLLLSISANIITKQGRYYGGIYYLLVFSYNRYKNRRQTTFCSPPPYCFSSLFVCYCRSKLYRLVAFCYRPVNKRISFWQRNSSETSYRQSFQVCRNLVQRNL